MKRKFQIFVSSTFTDLQNERQACVETILKAGHIPAGMELFAAGNESQLEIIKRWINECDIYMLLLGGRYGSIEPKSELSYTELEYQYALELGKPVFSLVITDDYLDDKLKKYGKSVLELENITKYKKFKELVLSKISKFFNSENEIRLSIMESIIDIQNRFNLFGWTKATDLEKTTLFPISVALKNAVSGRWKGNYEQVLRDKQTEIEIFMNLEVARTGKIIGVAKIPYGKDTFEVTLRGAFYLRSFIKLEYENSDKAIIQFGSFVFELGNIPNRLIGSFVGYGHITGKVISGPIRLQKD